MSIYPLVVLFGEDIFLVLKKIIRLYNLLEFLQLFTVILSLQYGGSRYAYILERLQLIFFPKGKNIDLLGK